MWIDLQQAMRMTHLSMYYKSFEHVKRYYLGTRISCYRDFDNDLCCECANKIHCLVNSRMLPIKIFLLVARDVVCNITVRR